MAWVKLDDSFPDHPKLAGLGDMAPLAGWQFVCVIAYCNRYLTDGHIRHNKAQTLVTWQHVGVETGGVPGMFAAGEDIDGEWACQRLEVAGLLEPCVTHEHCYLVHDYLDYQPSRAAVLAERSKTSARVREFRERRKNPRNAVTPTVTQARECNAVSNGAPVPVPLKVVGTNVPTLSGAGKKAAEAWAVENFVGNWCLMADGSRVPSVRLPVSDARRRAILRAVAMFPEYAEGLADGTEDTERLLEAFRQFVEDPFNGGDNDRGKAYGLDTFCAHVDRWRDAADAVLEREKA